MRSGQKKEKLYRQSCSLFSKNPMRITLKQLEAFYWAACCPSFAVAAARLNLSVSSLSKRLSELEVAVGKPLFVRHGNRSVLSDAGHVLLPRARGVLNAAEDLTDEAARPEGLTGSFRIGTGELTAMTWLPRFLQRICDGQPAVNIDVAVAVGSDLEHALVASEVDMAIVAAKSSNPLIASSPIGTVGFGWYGAAASVGRAECVEQALLDRLPLVSLPVGSGITRLVDDWLRGQGLVVRHRITCNHWMAVAGLLEGGLGIGVLPEGWARDIGASRALRRLACAPDLPGLAYFVQWRSDDYRGLVTRLAKVAREMAVFDRLCIGRHEKDRTVHAGGVSRES